MFIPKNDFRKFKIQKEPPDLSPMEKADVVANFDSVVKIGEVKFEMPPSRCETSSWDLTSMAVGLGAGVFLTFVILALHEGLMKLFSTCPTPPQPQMYTPPSPDESTKPKQDSQISDTYVGTPLMQNESHNQ